MTGGPEHPASIDGRTARRDRNRIAVLDAVLELFSEGNLLPSAEEVARRSGVSLRSVYRYVENTDDLIRAAVERRREQVAPLFELDHLGEGPLDQRIAALCDSRVRAYDEVYLTARAARARAYSVPILREQLEDASDLLRDQVASQFAPELAEMPQRTHGDVLEAVDALCQHESIERYRQRHGAKATSRMLQVALRRLLTASA
jgi:AcrR family transcriptional regulator